MCPLRNRQLETSRENPIPERIRAFLLNEIAVHRVHELDWRFVQWCMGYHANNASCLLHVGRFLAYSSNLEVQAIRSAKMFVSVHDTASQPRN
jgi:hypothetical protein